MNFFEFIQSTSKMHDLLNEPAFAASGANIGVSDHVVTETSTFFWDFDDGDSDVILTRDIDFDADGDTISKTRWTVTNAPTITDVVTDQTDDATVLLVGETELTITGTNFGAADADLEVVVYVQPAKGH